jgi:hypothetical protein
MGAGRPTVRCPEFAESICEHIANGGSLTDWCAVPGHPGYSTITDWLRDDPEFSAKYTRAREDQGDFYAEKVVATAEDCLPDVVEIQRAKLKIDAYKWRAGNLKPKVYGSKVDLTSDGQKLESQIVQFVMPSNGTEASSSD